MVRIEQIVLGHKFHQLLLDLHHIFPWCDARTVADAKDVSVYSHRDLTESGVEHDIGSLASYAR